MHDRLGEHEFGDSYGVLAFDLAVCRTAGVSLELQDVLDCWRHGAAKNAGAETIVHQLAANRWIDLRFVDLAPGGVIQHRIVRGKAGPDDFHGHAIGRRLTPASAANVR